MKFSDRSFCLLALYKGVIPMTKKYIRFNEINNPGKKTRIFEVINISGNYVLGVVRWYTAWRQYVFEPVSDTVYSLGCLEDIQKELKTLNYEQKMKLNITKLVRNGG